MLGVLAVIAWVAVTTGIVVFATKAIIGIRVSEEDEVTGLDYVEHGTSAYEVRDTYGAAFDRSEPFAQRLTELGKTYN